MEAFDQRFCFVVFLWIKFLMRMTIAAEKASQPEHAPAFRVPDDHRTAGPFLKQTDATQDQRAHDALAKFSFCDQQCAQPIRRNYQSIDRTFRLCIDERWPAGQLRQFAQERPRDVRNNKRTLAGQCVSRNVYFARRV